MSLELLKKEKMDYIFNCLVNEGHVECGNQNVELFVRGLGDMLHQSKYLSKVRSQLKNNLSFKQMFEQELRRVILEA